VKLERVCNIKAEKDEASIDSHSLATEHTKQGMTRAG
jgi:hypothetical protein